MQKFILKVGLTGGIGSGKTTVAEFFAELGAPVIDADNIARKITQPNTEIFLSIINHFGSTLVTPEGKLNRSLLRTIIFENSKEREWLESLLHPQILKLIEEQTQLLTAPYCLIAIPLLIEKDLINVVDRVLVVDSPKELQISRVTARDQTSEEKVEAIIQSQITREQRLAVAEDILVNNSDLTNLHKQVKELHLFYLHLANSYNQNTAQTSS